MPDKTAQDSTPEKTPTPEKTVAPKKAPAAPKKTTPPPAAAPPPDTALNSEEGKRWLHGELHTAERSLKHGPSGNGWIYNEALRPVAEERVHFLRALVALLPQ